MATSKRNQVPQAMVSALRDAEDRSDLPQVRRLLKHIIIRHGTNKAQALIDCDDLLVRLRMQRILDQLTGSVQPVPRAGPSVTPCQLPRDLIDAADCCDEDAMARILGRMVVDNGIESVAAGISTDDLIPRMRMQKSLERIAARP